MPAPIYRTMPAPRIRLLNRNGTDITARRVVGVDYNNRNCVEYTTYGYPGLCDGYFVEFPQIPTFILGTLITIDITNISPAGTTTPVNQTQTVNTNTIWPYKFILTYLMRQNLGPGVLEFVITVQPPAASPSARPIIYISFTTTMTASPP